MNREELKASVRDTVLAQRFPELSDVEPEIETGPEESRLRALRRQRNFVPEEELKAIPIEHRLIYQLPESENQPFERTVVVVTDDEANPKFIIESK